MALTGPGVSSGFLVNSSARNVKPDVTETISGINAQLQFSMLGIVGCKARPLRGMLTVPETVTTSPDSVPRPLLL